MNDESGLISLKPRVKKCRNIIIQENPLRLTNNLTRVRKVLLVTESDRISAEPDYQLQIQGNDGKHDYELLFMGTMVKDLLSHFKPRSLFIESTQHRPGFYDYLKVHYDPKPFHNIWFRSNEEASEIPYFESQDQKKHIFLTQPRVFFDKLPACKMKPGNITVTIDPEANTQKIKKRVKYR